MPNRHHHDEFISALLLSLLINILIILALMAPHSDEEGPGLRPINVTLTVPDPRRQGEPLPKKNGRSALGTATPRPGAAPPAAATHQRSGHDPLLPLPAQPEEEGVTPASFLAPSGEEKGELLPTGASAGEDSSLTEKSSDKMSIIGDKISGDHYTAPEYLVGKKPTYPERAERYGWEGNVLLTLSITAGGEVEDVRIAESSGYDLLDQQARGAVAGWRFLPARNNGRAVAATVQQQILFRRPLAGKKP